MCAWGPGMLENDVAMDALGIFDDQIAVGATVEGAISSVMEDMKDGLDDEDERADVILALAWLSSERRATPRWLADEARAIVTNEVALSRWEESDHYETRRAFEQALLAILDGATPHPGRPEGLGPQPGP